MHRLIKEEEHILIIFQALYGGPNKWKESILAKSAFKQRLTFISPKSHSGIPDWGNDHTEGSMKLLFIIGT
jgi:hypothetical protein